MNDEDRKDAHRLAKQYTDQLPNALSGENQIIGAQYDFVAGYAACAEKMRRRQLRCGECGNVVLGANQLDYVDIINAERARSARLLEEFKDAVSMIASEWGDKAVVDWRELIAEIEAKK